MNQQILEEILSITDKPFIKQMRTIEQTVLLPNDISPAILGKGLSDIVHAVRSNNYDLARKLANNYVLKFREIAPKITKFMTLVPPISYNEAEEFAFEYLGAHPNERLSKGLHYIFRRDHKHTKWAGALSGQFNGLGVDIVDLMRPNWRDVFNETVGAKVSPVKKTGTGGALLPLVMGASLLLLG